MVLSRVNGEAMQCTSMGDTFSAIGCCFLPAGQYMQKLLHHMIWKRMSILNQQPHLSFLVGYMQDVYALS